MNAPSALGKVEQIRARDGDACWLCTRLLKFDAAPNTKDAPTIEHLVAKSLGGGNDLANLVLCHKACNLHLADRPREKKEEMRIKFHANAAKVAAAKGAASASATPAPVAKPAPPKMVAAPAAASLSVSAMAPAVVTRRQLEVELAYWRRLALTLSGIGLFASGVVVGLLTRLLV